MGRRVWTPAQSRICNRRHSARGVSSTTWVRKLSARTVQSPAWFCSLADGILKQVVLLRELLHFCSPLSSFLSLSYSKHSSPSILVSSMPFSPSPRTPQCSSTMQDQAAKDNVAKTPPAHTKHAKPTATSPKSWCMGIASPVAVYMPNTICETHSPDSIRLFALIWCTCILPVFPAIKI
jgi:hypothetical protein